MQPRLEHSHQHTSHYGQPRGRLGLAAPALAAGPAPAGGMKFTSGACGKAPGWDECKLRSFDAKPDTRTPIPFELGLGRKDG